MRDLYLSPSARRDLAEIAEYISEAAGREIAAGVINGIRETCRLVAETLGEIGVARPEIGKGIRSFPVPPHVLFFRYTASEVEIVRILHERRDVENAVGE